LTSYINILPFVRKWEGGEVYFPEENQWTNRGVQWNTYKQLAPKLLGIQNPTISDLRNMSQEDGDKFIKYYWDKATFNNSIKNQAAANAFFEAYWGGGKSGLKWLQNKIGVFPDGIVGKKTVAKANQYDSEFILKEVLNRFNYLATSNPSRYGRFLKGWTNRWNDLYNRSKVYFVKSDELLDKPAEDNTNTKILQIAALFSVGFVIYKLITK
jgi:lysozyme family protein